MMGNSIVTTSNKPRGDLEEYARELARRLNLPYVARKNRSFECLFTEFKVQQLVVVTAERIYLKTRTGEFFFHPNMAKLRIKNLNAGKEDMLALATAVRKGDHVLDCTLGLGADAIVLSYLAGANGRVVGIESVPVLAEIVRQGLRTYQWGNSYMDAVLRRIEVITADHNDYLQILPDKCFDIVYFDPMFREPVYKSDSLQPLRQVANSNQLIPATIAQAKRVARRRVVLKERRGSDEFTRLGFEHIIGGKYSSIAFGYIQLEECQERE